VPSFVPLLFVYERDCEPERKCCCQII
jgi:hypothetical protein